MFIVTANSKEELERLVENKADAILLAVSPFSVRQNVFLKPEDLAGAADRIHKADLKVCVNAMKMLEEPELESARRFLEECKKADVDEIYIADEGWIELALEAGLENRLVYQPETLVVNGYDAAFYERLGFLGVSLAHELSLDEILECAKSCGILEVLVQGRYSWMNSRRRLLTSYFEETGRPVPKSDMLLFREQKREGLLPVVENEAGTVVWSDEPVCSYDEIEALEKAGITRFRIDTMFEDPDYGCRQLAAYRSLLAGESVPESVKTGSDHLYSMKTLTRKDENA